MGVTIKYKDILDKCVKLSAYDGKQSYTEQGVLRYKDIKIVEKDFPGLIEYIRQAAGIIDREIEKVLEGGTDYDGDGTDNGGLTLYVNEDLQIKGGTDINKTFLQTYVEAVACYVMSKWMEDKIDVRSKNYMDMHAQMLMSVKKIALSKKKPAWED